MCFPRLKEWYFLWNGSYIPANIVSDLCIVNAFTIMSFIGIYFYDLNIKEIFTKT